ncbi:MAG: YtxH domain-containing protein [Pegethrix bostrychoides GSE-TBD4-15B]|jgi:gas vesicle protein|uniref:YtxH domain-containing protein n=1 Tax=Pegethrix bostrychoides GSE-TBD4-15B TaxID=2839662 RepID=A0A951PG30_9CYAN|nr:YtxH domain-containing protein [Pegethrix bostrychoides GSE-TBD4-15B]
MSDRTNAGGIFVGGLLLGAAAGAVAGLLFAPKAGRETRELLRQSADALPELAEDLSATVQIQAERLSDSALRNWDNTLLRLREAIEAGIEASRQVEPPTQPPLPFAPLPEAQPGRDASLPPV